MNAEERAALVIYRCQRAWSTFEEAEALVREEFWHAASNRLYYAVYYAASAVLATCDQAPKTHKGVRIAILKLKAEGTLTNDVNLHIYHLLFELRHSGDYDDFVHLEAEKVLPLLPPARDIIDA